MRAIEYFVIFLLLGTAPSWQVYLDNFLAGLGTALLLLVLMGGIRAAQAETNAAHRSLAKSKNTRPSQTQI